MCALALGVLRMLCELCVWVSCVVCCIVCGACYELSVVCYVPRAIGMHQSQHAHVSKTTCDHDYTILRRGLILV